MAEQKQEVKKEVKKLCPFISGFLLEPVKDKLSGQMTGVGKSTNISPCIKEHCKFFNKHEQECEILCCFKNLKVLADVLTLTDEPDEQEQEIIQENK